MACAIALIAYAIHFASVLGIGTPTFIGNLSIEGTALSGLTYEEGVALISELEEQFRRNWDEVSARFQGKILLTIVASGIVSAMVSVLMWRVLL